MRDRGSTNDDVLACLEYDEIMEGIHPRSREVRSQHFHVISTIYFTITKIQSTPEGIVSLLKEIGISQTKEKMGASEIYKTVPET